MLSYRDINKLLSSSGNKRIFFSTINKVENLEASVQYVVQCIKNNDNLKSVYVDEMLAIKDEKKKKEIYNAFLRNPRFTNLFIDPAKSEGDEEDNKRLSLDHSFVLWVAQVLCQSKSLDHLSIYCVEFGNEAADIVARALRRNRTLKELWLKRINRNIIGDACDILVQAAIRSLRFRATLTTLSVKSCRLSEDTFVAIAEALRTLHSSLESLDIITVDDLPPQIGANILNAITTNKTLKEVFLNNLAADTDHLVGNSISHLLGNNTTLRLLRHWGPFSYERPGRDANEGIDVTSFASSLAIGEEGAVKLGRSLARNKGLRHLELDGNESMGERGIRAILDAVKANPTITGVLIGDSWGTAVKDELHFYLERNKGTKRLLSANPPLPLSLWPYIFKRADSCQHAPNDRTRPPHVLYDLIKEKADLFGNAPASRERKRRRGK